MTISPSRIRIVAEHISYEIDQDDIREILHYCHWIPSIRGITGSFFSKKYPEYDLRIVGVLRAAGALAQARGSEGHFSGYRPKKRVEKVQLWTNGKVKVIWKTKTSL